MWRDHWPLSQPGPGFDSGLVGRGSSGSHDLADHVAQVTWMKLPSEVWESGRFNLIEQSTCQIQDFNNR